MILFGDFSVEIYGEYAKCTARKQEAIYKFDRDC